MKHAFLIMAHTNYNLLGRLLKKLDHSDNTIYIHIDAKSPFSAEDRDFLVGCCRYSEIVMVDRYHANWGGYSLIDIELRMLECASSGNYDYYHFLSGADFPIKPMEYIHTFFHKNAGYEFVHFCSDDFNQKQSYRYRRFHFFQERCGRTNNIYRFVKRGLLFAQKILGVDRTKKYSNIDFKCGSQWASFTNEFAAYLLSKRKLIQSIFSFSFCCDEVFLQTILYNSPFKNKIFTVSEDEPILPNLRSIDWERSDKTSGSPYTYTIDDYEELVNSKNLFCRKVTDATPEGNALIEKLEQL